MVTATAINLKQLLPSLTQCKEDLLITGLAIDSRKIVTGDLFFAVPGQQVDGRNYIATAIKQGAAAVLYEKENFQLSQQYDIPCFAVTNLTAQIGIIASKFYNNPCKKVQVIGVTGTNGKSSIVHGLCQCFDHLKIPAAMLGTIGNGKLSDLQSASLTTDNPIALQKKLADYVSQGIKVVAMEVSAHALSQYRIAGLKFHSVIFSNLTRDHLDYYQTMQNYGNAKLKLFTEYSSQHKIINIDDKFSAIITSAIKNSKKSFISCSRKNPAADFFISKIKLNDYGAKLAIKYLAKQYNLSCPLLGDFQLSNILLIFACLINFIDNSDKIIASIAKLQAIPGRMFQVGNNNTMPKVIIDYAHTPDALEKALSALKPYCQGDLWCVFGCGGDRDSGRRAIMAKVVENLANNIVVTNDNPRTESPQKITNDICAGFAAKTNYYLEHDRTNAINYAIANAKQNDIVLVAGKGHEDYQIIGTEKIPFCEQAIIEQALKRRGR